MKLTKVRHFINRKLSSLINLSCASKEVPLAQSKPYPSSPKEVPLAQATPLSSSIFKLDEAGEGWVLRRNLDGPWRRMCWLPHKRRENGTIHACSGQRIVISATSGLLTILDFSKV
jgi:hypothetical protein